MRALSQLCKVIAVDFGQDTSRNICSYRLFQVCRQHMYRICWRTPWLQCPRPVHVLTSRCFYTCCVRPFTRGLARTRPHRDDTSAATDSHGLTRLGLYKFDVLGLEQLQHLVNLFASVGKTVARVTLQHPLSRRRLVRFPLRIMRQFF